MASARGAPWPLGARLRPPAVSPREQRGCPLAPLLPPGICAFKFHFCTMFTSFRFNTRRAALCEGNRPKRSFHEATSR